MGKKKYDVEALNLQFGEQIVKEYQAGVFAQTLAEMYLGNKYENMAKKSTHLKINTFQEYNKPKSSDTLMKGEKVRQTELEVTN